MAFKVLTPKQIERGKFLREQYGYTNRQLADYFNVPKTTIWDNIYAKRPPWKTRKRYQTAERQVTYRNMRYVVLVVTELKRQGHISKDIAHSFQIPLGEVNYIYARNW